MLKRGEQKISREICHCELRDKSKQIWNAIIKGKNKNSVK